MKKQIHIDVDIWSDVYNEAALESIRVEIRNHLTSFLKDKINDAPIGNGTATNAIDHRFGIDGTIKLVDRK